MFDFENLWEKDKWFYLDQQDVGQDLDDGESDYEEE